MNDLAKEIVEFISLQQVRVELAEPGDVQVIKQECIDHVQELLERRLKYGK